MGGLSLEGVGRRLKEETCNVSALQSTIASQQVTISLLTQRLDGIGAPPPAGAALGWASLWPSVVHWECGSSVSCVLTRNDSGFQHVYCWGNYAYGQLIVRDIPNDDELIRLPLDGNVA